MRTRSAFSARICVLNPTLCVAAAAILSLAAGCGKDGRDCEGAECDALDAGSAEDFFSQSIESDLVPCVTCHGPEGLEGLIVSDPPVLEDFPTLEAVTRVSDYDDGEHPPGEFPEDLQENLDALWAVYFADPDETGEGDPTLDPGEDASAEEFFLATVTPALGGCVACHGPNGANTQFLTASPYLEDFDTADDVNRLLDFTDPDHPVGLYPTLKADLSEYWERAEEEAETPLRRFATSNEPLPLAIPSNRRAAYSGSR